LNPKPNRIVSVAPTPLPIAVRAFLVPPEDPDRRPDRPSRRWPLPRLTIVFDTETRTDATQRLTFGSYRAFVDGRFIEEGLFYGDDLSRKEMRILRRYAKRHAPDTHRNGLKTLRLVPLSVFRKELFKDAYKTRCLLVAFNHPFDLSRIAQGFRTARREPYSGGFSLSVWTYKDKNGKTRRDPNRPCIDIKHIDSKRALIGFTSRLRKDREDLIPENSSSNKPQKGNVFRGHFLDLRTLAFALTDQGHTLASACSAFEVENSKIKTSKHGEISTAYIDYNRRDVLATAELATKLLQEFRKHPIPLQATKAFSPASIGKGYLRRMGIEPILKRQPDFPPRYLGHAQSAFFGGRASAHIRKVPVPVVYTDFLSMYPTVNSLMRLWQFVTAQEIRVVRRCRSEVQRFLRSLSPTSLFKQATWKRLCGFVRVIPNGDILPSRSKYSVESNDWQIGLNHLSAADQKPKNGLWYSLPDVIASKLLTGRTPTIVEAFRIERHGKLKTLSPVKLRNVVKVDPRVEDFFKVVIEQRHLLPKRRDLSESERKRLHKSLKVLANATSYGIYGEMLRRDSEKKMKVTCYGIDPTPSQPSVLHPEEPHGYCFPPLASLITGGARLMLALLERSVTELGGTYAMEDTDSMAIVSTRSGGLIPCPGGPYRTEEGKPAINALSWKDVNKIAKRFEFLNPYDRKSVQGSILKIEDDNWHPQSKRQRQLYCFAISAKRYALFVKDANGNPVLLRERLNNDKDRWSEHGLGHVLNPSDPTSEDRDRIGKVWLNIVRRSLGLSTVPLGFESVPAVGRISVSSPAIASSLEYLNRGKKYPDQIKPFNFLMSCHVKPFGHPLGCDPEHFHLISPYEMDPRKWLRKDWIDEYSDKPYRITTTGPTGDRYTARVKTFGELLQEYEFHPESKCSDSNGNPCERQTTGLLHRRHIQIEFMRYVGKESNSLEDVESGIVHSGEDVYTEYADSRRDEWTQKILPALKQIRLRVLVQKLRGRLSRRAIIDLRAGRSRPRRRTLLLLAAVVSFARVGRYGKHARSKSKQAHL
jgi:hypothetical protein